MSRPLGTTLEIAKLAETLRLSTNDLAGLEETPATEIRDLRVAITTAMHERHERRFRRLASLVKLVPLALAAGIAEHALGPTLSARVAAAMDPDDACTLAQRLDPAFLTDVAVHLDPRRVSPIIGALPSSLVVDVGRRLLRRGDLAVLGRLVSAVSAPDALAVAESAGGEELLTIGLFTEEPAVLDALIGGLRPAQLTDIVSAAAASEDLDEAVALVSSLGPPTIAQLIAHLVALPSEQQDLFVQSIARQGTWEAVLPAVDHLPSAPLRTLLESPTLLDPGILDEAIRAIWAAQDAGLVVPLILALDDEHLESLTRSEVLREPALQEWLLSEVARTPRPVRAVLHDLGFTS